MCANSWRLKSGVVGFSFDLRDDLASPVCLRMARAMDCLLTLLGDVARPTQGRMGTLAQGEDAQAFALPAQRAQLLTSISHRHDVTDVALDCDLLCVALDPSSFVIAQVMTVWVSRANLDDVRETCPLELQLSLDVDVYAAVHDDGRDNRALARLNAPRFNEFLKCVQSVLPADITDVDAVFHAPGLINRDGFAIVD